LTTFLSSPFLALRVLTEDYLYGKFKKLRKDKNIVKHAALKNTAEVLHKIEIIEKEVMDLKLSILKKLTPSGKKVISLKGIFKGVDITNKDITSAKKSHSFMKS